MAPPSSTLAWKIPWTEEAADHGVAKSRKQLSDFTFTFHFHALEKARGEGMAEDEMFERHHRLKRHEFEQTPGDSEGLVCCYVATTEFSRFAGILSAALSQHHLSGFETQLECYHLH